MITKRRLKLTYLTLVLALLSLGCGDSNGYYSSMQDFDTEEFLVGKNEFVEINFSANQIGDEINVILYQNNNTDVNAGLLLSELTGNVNGIDFGNAKKKVYFGAEEIEFKDFSELKNNMDFMEHSGNLKYYFKFNRSDFESINKLKIHLMCQVKSDSREFVFKTNVKIKRHVRIYIHP